MPIRYVIPLLWLVCSQTLECVSGMHIYMYIQDMVVVSCSYDAYAVIAIVSYTTCITTELCYMYQKVAWTQFNGLMTYIIIYDLIDYHIYINCWTKHVLLFGVHIRGLLDKSFCRVTYKILLLRFLKIIAYIAIIIYIAIILLSDSVVVLELDLCLHVYMI